MIILEKTKQVQFQGNFDTIKVGIDEKNISHFFRMIANLYQDPVMAVLREIGANCVDAIKEAKTEKLGWQLHLPSRMDGNVRFVDNGVGISHDQMIRIYSIIGASSKRDDNNLIGGFGVGKWSLCSLVNNFQAISIHNGTKSTYFICLQSNGLPDIKVIKQEQTNERNGFEVKFMCPEKYIGQFNDKAIKAYRFFSIKPNVYFDGVKRELDYGKQEVLFS
jgi:HSP90 family molecular chaperone